MKLCSIDCETKSHNLPVATYISGKIIFHALIYTVSFYWVASCAVSIKSTEDGWESHLKIREYKSQIHLPGGKENVPWIPASPITTELFFCKTPEKKILHSWFSCVYLFALAQLLSWAPPSPASPSPGHLSLGKAGWQFFSSQQGGCLCAEGLSSGTGQWIPQINNFRLPIPKSQCICSSLCRGEENKNKIWFLE